MSATTVGGLIGAGIDAITGGEDDSVMDGALIGAATANVLKIVAPVVVTYAVGWMVLRSLGQLRGTLASVEEKA